MGQEDPGLPTSEGEIVTEKASTDIEDIDQLATTPPHGIRDRQGHNIN